jgi:hypothetical protein
VVVCVLSQEEIATRSSIGSHFRRARRKWRLIADAGFTLIASEESDGGRGTDRVPVARREGTPSRGVDRA